MLSSANAISIFRRDLTVGALLRGALLAGALACMVLSAMPVNKSLDGTVLLVGIAMVWLALSYRSVKGQRMAADSILQRGSVQELHHHEGKSLVFADVMNCADIGMI